MLNVFCFVGALYSEPVYRKYESRKKKGTFIDCCYFPVIIQDDVKWNGKRLPPTYVNISCYNKEAVFAANYLHKGDVISGHGKIRTQSYLDKNGNTIWTARCFLYSLRKLYKLDFDDKKKQTEKKKEEQKKSYFSTMNIGNAEDFDIDIPDNTEFDFT